MTEATWLWPARILGGAIAFVLVGLGTTSVISGFFFREERERTPLGSISRAVVRTNTGEITVRVGAAGEPASLTVVKSSDLREPRVSWSVLDGALQVDAECPGRWTPAGRTCTVDVELAVRPGTELALRTAVGDITVIGADAPIRAQTSVGSIDVLRTTAEEVMTQAATGAVQVELLEPPRSVAARASAGSVEVLVPPDGTAYRVDASTSVGDRRVTVPVDSSAPRVIEAVTSVGSVLVGTG